MDEATTGPGDPDRRGHRVLRTSARRGCPTASTWPPRGDGACWSSARPLALILWLLNFFLVVVLPLVIALLLAALVAPVVTFMARHGMPRKLAALVVVVLGIAAAGAAVHLRRQPGLLRRLRPVQPGRQRHRADPRLAAHRPAARHRRADQLRPGQRAGPAAELRQGRRRPAQRGRRDPRPRPRRPVHRALRDLLLPRRRHPDLGLARAALPAGGSAPRRLLGPRGVGLADPVRPGDGAGGRDRRHRHHDRCRWSSRCRSCSAIGVLVFIGAFVPLVGAFVSGTVAVLVALVAVGPGQGADHVRRDRAGPADRGPRPAALPDGPVRLGPPARRDRGHRDGGARGRHPGRPGRRTAGRVGQRGRPAPRGGDRRRRGRQRTRATTRAWSGTPTTCPRTPRAGP